MQDSTLKDRLRLLLINDEEDVDLGTDLIEVVSVPNQEADPINRLGSWTQHMSLWTDGAIPTFDLLLIDINFFQDPTGPEYLVNTSGRRRELEVNPFGLLHALPLAALQRSTKMPFVWQIHSFKPEDVAYDPVAQWAVGMLLAMQGDDSWLRFAETNKHSPISDYFSEYLENLPSMAPSNAWPLMIQQYRERLLEACDDNLEVDSEKLQYCLQMANARGLENIEKLKEESLIFGSDNYRSLRSLFADMPTWDQRGLESDVLPFLQNLQAASSFKELYNEITQVMGKLERQSNISINTATRDFQNGKDRALVQLGAVIFFYLEYYAKTERAPSASWVIEKLGYEEGGQKFRILSRILSKAGISDSPARFVASLRTTSSIHPKLRLAAAEYWKNGMESRANIKPGVEMPRFIQSPERRRNIGNSTSQLSLSTKPE